MTSSELSRRAFLQKSATMFAATLAGIPQVIQALPKAATDLGKVKITDIKTAQIMARYVFNLVKIETDSGLFGIGEAFARQGIVEHIHAMKPLLVGQDPLLIEHHWQYLYRWTHFRGSLIMGALSAIDIALWDIAGKARREPVAKLLGGMFRTRVEAYATGFYRIKGQGEAARLAQEAEGHVAKGFRALKIKLGFGIDDDLAQEMARKGIALVTTTASRPASSIARWSRAWSNGILPTPVPASARNAAYCARSPRYARTVCTDARRSLGAIASFHPRMRAIDREIPGDRMRALLAEVDVYRDNRGFFIEVFRESSLAVLGLPRFVQANHSHSRPGVLRGLHFQLDPPQGKLLCVVCGADLATDPTHAHADADVDHRLAPLEALRRDLDRSGAMDGADRFQQQAFDVITRGVARASTRSKKPSPKRSRAFHGAASASTTPKRCARRSIAWRKRCPRLGGEASNAIGRSRCGRWPCWRCCGPGPARWRR